MYTSTTTLVVSVLTYKHLHKHFYQIKLNQIYIFVPGALTGSLPVESQFLQ